MGFCDGCNLKCQAATNGRCAKTEAIVADIAQRWDNKGQQQRIAAAERLPGEAT